MAASARRLRWAVAPTALDASVLLGSLRGEAGHLRFRRVCDGIAECTEADWERDLIAAIDHETPVRVALVNEQLTELDERVRRWSRVPRVCASISSSSAFLLASLALQRGLAEASDGVAGAALVSGAVMDAVNVASIGLLGTSFCIAVQMYARRAAKAREQAADELVERLEALSS